MPDQPRLAVLVDGENVSPVLWPEIAATTARLGDPVIVRVYSCNENNSRYWAMIPDVTLIDGWPASGPNAADFLLAMDAVDIALTERVDEFLIVSGDTDFAAVMRHLRRWTPRISVLIAPNNKAPAKLIAAADIAILLPPVDARQPSVSLPFVGWKSSLLALVDQSEKDADGWIELSKLGTAAKAAGQMPPGKLLDRVRALQNLDVCKIAGLWHVRKKSRSRP